MFLSKLLHESISCNLVFLNFGRTFSNQISSKSKKLQDLLLNMPKDQKHIVEAQKQRLKIKARAARYPPGVVNIQVLGNGSKGSPAVVYLFSDQTRYIINCGEGTQRLAHEHKLKLARLENIFLTRTTWDKIGGVPGLCLTLQETGVPNLALYGPRGIKEIFDATRKFVVLRDLRVEVPDCKNEGFFEDSVLTMHYIHLYKDEDAGKPKKSKPNEEFMKDNPDFFVYEGESSDQSKNEDRTDSSVSWEDDDERREEEYVMAYICKLKERPGALDLEKCVEKGVTPGPLLGKLKNGHDVLLDNGTLILAKDVTGPTDPGPVCIFIDIPDEKFLKALQNSQKFYDYQATATNDSDMALCVVHFSPPHIVENPIYQEFIEKFSPSTKHFCLNENNEFSGYVATHRIQWQLNQLDKYIFPILKELPDDSPFITADESHETSLKKLKLDIEIENKPKENGESSKEMNGNAEESEASTCDISLGNSSISQADRTKVAPLTMFHLRPRRGVDLGSVPQITPKAFVEETTVLPGFLDILEKVHQLKAESHIDNSIRKNDYPKIVFLGTGSCIPNKTRNVSGILIHINKDNCMFFDCGEGSYAQIYRLYGPEETDNILKKTKSIFISHLHADHHIGLIEILKRRRPLNSAPILLCAPQQIYPWLFYYDLHIERISDTYDLIPNAELVRNQRNAMRFKEIGLNNIQTCFVRHCPYAFAVSVEMCNNTVSAIFNQPKIKITYSGDTIPCRNLVELGKNSTVLIHEATMEDDMEQEARYKMHSTVSQAIEQGEDMNAKYTILTHFSQRYAKIPRMDEDVDDNVAIAFDNMELTLNDLPLLHFFYAPLKVMFAEHCQEMEVKALKRQYKRERFTPRNSPTPVQETEKAENSTKA